MNNMSNKILKVECSTTADIQKPSNLNHDENLYIIYSPDIVRTRPCVGAILNLKTKLDLPPGIKAGIGLLPTFIVKNLTIKNFKRFSNKTKDKFISLDLLNRNFYNTVTIKKNQELAYLILTNVEEDKKLTTHKIID